MKQQPGGLARLKPQWVVHSPMRFRLLFASAILAGLSLRLWIAWLSVEQSFRLSVPDDAYYYFTIAKNVAAGYGATADRLAPNNGFHPLWLILIVPFWWMFGSSSTLPVHLALSTNAILDTAAAIVLYLLGLRLTRNQWLALLGTAIYLLNPYGVTSGVNGLETSLAVFLFGVSLAIGWKILDRPKHSIAWWFASGLAWGLLLLARTDYILVAIPCLLYTLWKTRREIWPGRLSVLWVGVALPLLPWVIWNFYTFGVLVQVSADAYPYYQHVLFLSQQGLQPVALVRREADLFYAVTANLSRFFGMSRFLPVAVLFVAAVLWVTRKKIDRKPLERLAVPTLFAALTLFYHALYRWMFVPWYYVPMAYLGALWLILGFALLWQNDSKWVMGLALSALVLLYGYSAIDLARIGGVFPLQQASSTSDVCGAFQRIGVTDSGFTGYFARCLVVNLDGVVNNVAFRAIRDGRFHSYLDSIQLQRVSLNDIVANVVALKEGPTRVFPPFR